jgi:hypothetical protein
MKTAHAKLNINNAQFNALAEDLYFALGKAGVAYRQQNRLMALLAPMQHDIVKSGPVTPAAPFAPVAPAAKAAPVAPTAPAAPSAPVAPPAAVAP